MKVGDLVVHSDMPKAPRILGIVVETYVDLNYCQVMWLDVDGERFNHSSDSLEVVSESR